MLIFDPYLIKHIMITASSITKSYDDVHVLKGIDLSVDAGEIVSIVGKSGAGKSTLLHILGTLDRVDSGSLTLMDRHVESLNEKELARFRNENIGFVFQFHHLLQEFTALENVCIPAYIGKKSPAQTETRAKELLDYLGLSDRMTHKPNQLSGGEAQRVAVARALINQPSMVFADEPTGNLDKTSSENLHQLFSKLRDDFKYTFVIVTHNLELAEMSDRIITIEDGKVKQG
ncbi:MAG: ABC transporter [Bacteroidetes bacterium OLB9]|nr:MAG: ABC transporter [Bacteroidetes bacterium OLB9]MCZ2339536.1 ABC transporter ATP-binding protein [Chitinophagales bacterium]